MAKSKQRSTASATQRREKTRQQQQQKQHVASPQSRGPQKRRRAAKGNLWPYVISTIVLVGVIDMHNITFPGHDCITYLPDKKDVTRLITADKRRSLIAPINSP